MYLGFKYLCHHFLTPCIYRLLLDCLKFSCLRCRRKHSVIKVPFIPFACEQFSESMHLHNKQVSCTSRTKCPAGSTKDRFLFIPFAWVKYIAYGVTLPMHLTDLVSLMQCINGSADLTCQETSFALMSRLPPRIIVLFVCVFICYVFCFCASFLYRSVSRKLLFRICKVDLKTYFIY